jgi:hypothetical protein
MEEEKRKISQATRRHILDDGNVEEPKCLSSQQDNAALRMGHGNSGISQMWLH